MYSILLITTNSPERFDILTRVIKSIDTKKVTVKEKVLTVDQFPEIETDYSFFKGFVELGWTVVYKHHSGRNSMALNQLNGLAYINSDWVLYCEDDADFRKIPQNSVLERILNQETGFISLNSHVDEFPTQETYRYCLDINNYRQVEDFWLLKKDNVIFQKKWFLNFPSCFIRKNHLKFLLEYSLLNYKNVQYSIEEGLSNAWFANGFSEKFTSYIISENIWPRSNKSLQIKEEDILQYLHDCAILNYWSNDPTTRIDPVNNKASMWF